MYHGWILFQYSVQQQQWELQLQQQESLGFVIKIAYMEKHPLFCLKKW